MDEKQDIQEMATELANRPLVLVIIETGLFVLIALTALIGNSCVLFVFYKTPHLRTVTSYYLIALAISDVAMAVLVMPSIIAVSVCGCDVLGALGGDIVNGYILGELLFGSLQTTSLIAVNRYFCVVKPAVYRKHFRPKKAILMIISCWVFTLGPVIVIMESGVASMEFYGSRYMYFPHFIGPYTAYIYLPMYQILFTIHPATMTIVCFWKIHQQVKSHKASLAWNRNTNGATSLPVAPNQEVSVVSNQPSPSSIVENQRASLSVERGAQSVEMNHTSPLPVAGNQTLSLVAQTHSTSSPIAPNPTSVSVIVASNPTLPVPSSVEEIKLTKSMMVIVIGFCICWLPSSTILHISAYVHLPRLVEGLFVYFSFASSAINPILYNIYSRPFRRRAWQLLGLRNVVTAGNTGFTSNLSPCT